jgi:hypothetical protein
MTDKRAKSEEQQEKLEKIKDWIPAFAGMTVKRAKSTK